MNSTLVSIIITGIIVIWWAAKCKQGGKKSVQDNRSDQKLHNDCNGGGDSDTSIMGLTPKVSCNTDAGAGKIEARSREEVLRDVTKRAKRTNRGKRRR